MKFKKNIFPVEKINIIDRILPSVGLNVFARDFEIFYNMEIVL